jgi:raffinose/stachyose/melibiose transport system substrate-binding protein
MSEPSTPVAGTDGARAGWRRWFNASMFGVLILVGACAWSLLRVLSIQHEINDPTMKIIRICHWQLESGYREGLQQVIDAYNELHAGERIRVLQVPVTEKVYAQWLNVNLIADNAPDIAEMGKARLAQGENVAKYFLPLGREVLAPNPYNAPELLIELKQRNPDLIKRLTTAPWRETLVDGMQGGYYGDLQDYYSVPSSVFTQRMFYNKELFRQALGSDRPPASFGELLDICDRLRAWAAEQGRDRFDPIAGTRYHRELFVNAYRVPFTAGYRDALDLDLSGDLSALECWAGFQAGKIGMGDPALRAYFEAIRDLCGAFNRGFAAMDRDQAIAAFSQGRSAMMASGWDAGSIFHVAKFEVGVCPFPLPAEGSRYGEYANPGSNEASTNGSSGYGVTKSCKHPEIALDFLRFLTSHTWNQRMNQASGWLPITIGAVPVENMSAFAPNPYGLMGRVAFDGGYDLQTIINGKFDQFLGREQEVPTYDVFADFVSGAMKDPATGIDRIWFKNWEGQRDNARALERTLAVQQARLLMGTATEETPARVRGTLLDQMLPNYGANLRLLYQRQNGRPLPEGK